MSNYKHSKKKSDQLGMNHSTASGRLVKDLLWNFIVETGFNKCSKCTKEMNRENFSIEHIEPWLDSDNPRELFFDISNIAYSHLSCNISSSRNPNQKYFSEDERRTAKAKQSREWWNSLTKEKQRQLRRKKYISNGK